MSNDYEVRFATNQSLPPGYRVVWSEATEHYSWTCDDGRESVITCDRFHARRGAWHDYESRASVPPSETAETT